ncbi:hypothetical protein BC936DRAFT_143402, partial [Jimgerdemannia flammicorona]
TREYFKNTNPQLWSYHGFLEAVVKPIAHTLCSDTRKNNEIFEKDLSISRQQAAARLLRKDDDKAIQQFWDNLKQEKERKREVLQKKVFFLSRILEIKRN